MVKVLEVAGSRNVLDKTAVREGWETEEDTLGRSGLSRRPHRDQKTAMLRR